MSRTSGSPSWAPKLPRYKSASRQSQFEQSLRAQTMGQIPSQEARAGANGDPEPLHLHNPGGWVGHRTSTHAASKRTMKATTQRKDSNEEHDASSGGDEDVDSEWSDWNAKANTTAKRTFTPERDLGQPTYDTTSGTEEDVSEAEEPLSIASNNTPRRREDLQKLKYVGSPVDSPTQSGDQDIQDGKENGALQSPVPTNRREDVQTVASGDKAYSRNGGHVESSTEDLPNEPVQARTAHKTQRTFPQQPLLVEENSEPNSPNLRDAGRQDEGHAPVRTAASDQDTSSPSSIFDLVQDSALFDTTPLQNANLKRKRRSAGEKISGVHGQPTHKRRKHSLFSPPTSVPPEDEDVPRGPSPGLKAIQGSFKINRPVVKPKSAPDQVRQDQGSMATWVNHLSLNSSLKHPLFNPSPSKRPFQTHATDRLAQNAKASAAVGSSALSRFTRKPRRGKDEFPSIVEDSSNDEASSIGKASRTAFTSTKGKSKARPGIRYSSPPTARNRVTSFRASKKSGGERRPTLSKSSPTEDDFLDHEVEQSIMRDSESGSNVNNSDEETGEPLEDSSALEALTCRTCNREFTVEKQLRSHKKNNSAHAKLYECWKCGEEYGDKTSLLRHQSREKHLKETFHIRKTGPFSDNEIHKLKKFMVDYCDEHGIGETDFRQMMTDSSRRGRDARWSWPGVKKVEFLSEYYDVLPSRAHKSMLRYKERYFQNLDHKKEWTEEDDKLLLELVDELGPKWIEIGLRLSRTQDSVTSRYKKKLKSRNTAQSGTWSPHEKRSLAKAIEDIKDELGLEKTPDTDGNITWSEVSKRMGGIRTAHQCSTHWHRVLKRKLKSGYQSTKGGQEVKSKEVVSSDNDDEPGVVESELRRERFAGVSLPKMPAGSAHHAKLTNSSESDSHDLETQQDDDDPRRGPYTPTQRQISLQLGSLDRNELKVTPTPSEANSDDIADPADHGIYFNEPVVRTAEEWERLLAVEESLPTLDATDLDYGIPESQNNQDGHENVLGDVPEHASSAKRKSPAADSKTVRNPFIKDTPGGVMALSQIFEQTQAPTSVPRQLTRNRLEGPASSSSRPSPDIGIRLRPTLPQDLSTSQQESFRQSPFADGDGNDINHDIEMEEIGDSSDESDEDTDMESIKKTRHVSGRPDEKHVASLEDSEPEDLDREEDHIPARPATGSSADEGENGPLLNREAESSEDNDTGEADDDSEDGSESAEEGSVSAYESAIIGGSDDEDEKEDSIDSMVKDTHNDFMANIKESAKLSRLQRPNMSRSITEESYDDDDDSE